MLPILFEIGGLSFHSYGVLYAAGVGLGILGTVWLGTREGMPADWFWDLALALIVGIVLGARLEYVRTRWPQFAADPMRILDLRDGGMVFYGGFIGVVLCMSALMWWRKMPAWKIFDIYAVLLPFGLALSRVGCLLAGCCYGLPTTLPWGVTYPAGARPPAGIPLHPTQLYETLYCALLGVALAWIRAHRRFEGQAFISFFLIYPLFRIANESLRGDTVRGYAIGALTNAQAISLLLIAAGAGMWLVRGTARRSPAS